MPLQGNTAQQNTKAREEVNTIKTVIEWEKHFDTTVLDGDGFPNETDRGKTLFTEKEFLVNCQRSTIKFSTKMIDALGELDLHTNKSTT